MSTTSEPPPLPLPKPKRSETLSTTWSDMDGIEEGAASADGNTGLWSLLAAASKYEDLEEADEDDDESDESSSGPHTPPPESTDLHAESPTDLTAPSTKDDVAVHPRVVDENGHALAISATLAKLAVNDFNIPARESLLKVVPEEDETPVEEAPTPREGNAIVRILQREFGVLHREGETEEFLKETDCALLTEATILGTSQLTNFRLAFHASLLSARFDEAPELQIIKAGPFVFHPPGLRRKRRRWLELSHNMLSVYRNSTDEGRARPIRSLLLSSIIRIHEYDPKKPREMRCSMNKASDCYSVCVLEFDTEEAAVDWHREFTAALFNYRQRRNRTLYGDGTSSDPQSPGSEGYNGETREGSGVRICIPLHRIESHSMELFADMGVIVTLVINDEPLDLDSVRVVPQPTPLSSQVALEKAQAAAAGKSNRREFKLFLFKKDNGVRFGDYVTAAKARRDRHVGKPVLDADLVTIDFGPLTFADPNETLPGDKATPAQAKRQKETIEKKMRDAFAVSSEVPVFINRAWLAGRVCSSGYLLVSSTFLCFWSKSFAARDIKLRFPMSHINTCVPLSTTLLGQHLIGIEVRGHPLIQFGIQGHELRDTVIQRVLAARDRASTINPRSPAGTLRTAAGGSSSRQASLDLSELSLDTRVSTDTGRSSKEFHLPGTASPTQIDDWMPSMTSHPSTIDSDASFFSAKLRTLSPEPAERSSTIGPNTTLGSVGAEVEFCPIGTALDEKQKTDPNACNDVATSLLAPISHSIDFIRTHEIPAEAFAQFPKPINLPRDVLRGMKSRHFVCLTIGSRGDVQPYIALCRGLIQEGHTATIVTHDEYKDWIEGFGVKHRAAGGDPGALMKLSVEHSMFSPQFFKESLGKFRGWLDDLLRDSWLQCQDADVLIESPSAMAGVHIAEALHIPYIRAFTMPWTRTQAYPHAFLSPPVELSGSLNYSTYVVFDNVFWTAMSGQVNRWRKKMLGIKRTDIDTLAQTKIPFIYNFSSSVVPKPIDWSDLITISGYWFLDNPDLKWAPSPELLTFIKSAKEDNVPIVYIGFGSIVVPHPHAMTRSIIKGVLKAGVRAIISKGWSDRLSKETDEEVKFPPECFSLDKVPHDWLFPQIDAAMHHGGAGTTGASLRAGIPTIIKPWFGDQYFWAGRVHKLGAGLRVDSLGSSELSAALKRATSDRVMKEKAAAVGEKIRSEDGVRDAIRSIYMYMERARKDRTTL